ncbi:DUF808 domain-containing protein [Corynebacterium glucuronolyticum]|uniref:DUF808 domain-containing protein n=1 Tax=Corynebacterium glucuronolyticum TaxID=39791 RepID=UPI00223A857F|nr:DUF808 domain-containing protein [Corynebacterium glucuronolyticum]MCT1441764.1 DUF808 domain-containing protein [Corynebacterium glucuronolyticum]
MAGGLAALLDDVALIARAAASSIDDVAAAAGHTSVKAAGVVVDDAAVTPQYVQGVTPARELPIIWRIAKGSLFNKLVLILPFALLLSWLAPAALTPILMLGGCFLTYEGMHKVIAKITGTDEQTDTVQVQGPGAEDALVKSAVTTDLILSAEIMVISLGEVTDQPFFMRLTVLVLVAIGITALVYGAVALLVKMDDLGMSMAKSSSESTQSLGRGLVSAMPKALNVIAVVGTAAMLWVGGHLIVNGADTLGWHAPAEYIHHLAAGVGGGFIGWLVDTACSMVVGAIVGTIVVIFISIFHALTGKTDEEEHEGVKYYLNEEEQRLVEAYRSNQDNNPYTYTIAAPHIDNSPEGNEEVQEKPTDGASTSKN